MGEIQVNLQDEQNWQLAYNETIQAGRLSANEYYPIKPLDLPILIESSIILVIAENINAKPWWFLGCRMQQIVQTGIAPGEVLGSLAKIPVNRPKLQRFPRLSAQYALRVEIPPWFDRMKIVVYEYIGPIEDSTEQLLTESTDLIRIDLLRIETKLNNL